MKRSNLVLVYNLDCSPIKYVGETIQSVTNRNSLHKTDINAGKVTASSAIRSDK